MLVAWPDLLADVETTQRRHSRIDSAVGVTVYPTLYEGLSFEEAADRLGVTGEQLTHTLHRRPLLQHFAERLPGLRIGPPRAAKSD